MEKDNIFLFNARYPEGKDIVDGWILVHDGMIEACGRGAAPEGLSGTGVALDCKGGLVMPGMIDTHVHFREPGLEHKGNIESESRAAVLGGVTSFIDMPNTVPATTTAEALDDKYARAAGRAYANYGFMLGAVDGVVDELEKTSPGTVPAVKLFMGTTTGAMSMPCDAELEKMMLYCSDKDIPVVVHAEDNSIIAANTRAAIERYGSREAVPVSEHSSIRSREACLSSARVAVEMARKYGTRLHLAHVSTADEISLLSREPLENKRITAETTPMYLDPVLANPSCRNNRHKINPAVKEPRDAKALREAVASGAIDTIATDHAPHLLSEKAGGALTAASGAPSVQFALPLLLSYLPAQLVAEKTAKAPALLFGIKKRGAIAPGKHADLVLLHKGRHTIQDSDVASPCGWTPFVGRTVDYTVDKVWVNGVLAVADGAVVSSPYGKKLEF